MLYAIRNPEGRIIGLTESARPGLQAVDVKNREVLEFLSINDEDFSAEEFLDQSDVGTVRIIEDMIDVLIAKNLILFTDFPLASQKKLLSRKLARSIIQSESAEPQTRPSEGPHAPSILIEDDDAWL
ncbi:hypothetical protein [Marinobacterium rhizophilum]|uniref:Uncharacterized protein n=1 Tax=Marinobacterium rhizophilum TaxID=420402 RepID=A0ABY5HQU7_9GAMM|nr:hypothetical protein [Marinobacterium rhizophilum]UTW13938.1 hypothetical protein KDW95_10000 [Marinobacterium rhizophilum]